jgi:hypothetical protein
MMYGFSLPLSLRPKQIVGQKRRTEIQTAKMMYTKWICMEVS